MLEDAVESVGMAALTMQGGKKRLAQDLQEGGVEAAKKSIKQMWFNALDESHAQYGKDSVKGDAYRHYQGSRRTAQKYGPAAALAVGTQHELKNAYDFARGEYAGDFSLGDLLAASGQDMINNLRGVIDGTFGQKSASPDNLSTMDRTYKGR